MGENEIDALVSSGDPSKAAARRAAAAVVAVRPACPDDATALALVHIRAWQAAYRGLMPQPYLDSLDVDERAEAWRQRLSEPTVGAGSLVGTVADRVAGFVSFGSSRDVESGDAGELYALNVHPELWGAGLGSALLSAAHSGLAGLGFDEGILWVVPGNARARRFYERHGWAVEQMERTLELQGVAVAEVRYARRLP